MVIKCDVDAPFEKVMQDRNLFTKSVKFWANTVKIGTKNQNNPLFEFILIAAL